jgi:hypothetical protein
MDKAFPLRVESHQLEEISERFFAQSLPKNLSRHSYTVAKSEVIHGSHSKSQLSICGAMEPHSNARAPRQLN